MDKRQLPRIIPSVNGFLKHFATASATGGSGVGQRLTPPKGAPMLRVIGNQTSEKRKLTPA